MGHGTENMAHGDTRQGIVDKGQRPADMETGTSARGQATEESEQRTVDKKQKTRNGA